MFWWGYGRVPQPRLVRVAALELLVQALDAEAPANVLSDASWLL